MSWRIQIKRLDGRWEPIPAFLFGTEDQAIGYGRDVLLDPNPELVAFRVEQHPAPATVSWDGQVLSAVLPPPAHAVSRSGVDHDLGNQGSER